VLITELEKILFQDKLFLRANLKMVDIAHLLDVPEYKVSRTLRAHFNARNFNQFINSLRVKHAKALLETPDNQHWSILVVGLESGFGSIGPFNRAFKSEFGVTPNEYRQSLLIGKEIPESA
jgi:AraC-like DNA-binding protein